MLTNLEYLQPITWDDVFFTWQQDEINQPRWVESYTKRGFDTWSEWRELYAQAFRCPERSWHLYQVQQPLLAVPTFRGGPFKTWIERHYGGQPSLTFAELAQREDMQQNASAQSLLVHFPAKTQLIGLVQNREVIIIEGMHRCVAIALAAQQGTPLTSTVHIALADATGDDLPPIGQFTKQH